MTRSRRGLRAAPRALTLALLLLAAPLWSACGSSPSHPAAGNAATPAAASPAASSTAPSPPAAAPPAGSSAAKLIPVNIAWVAVSTHTLPMWVAAQEGFYRAQGLDAHISYIHGSVTATAAMMSGGIDIIEEAPSTAVEAALKGADTVILATHIPYADQVVVSAPNATGIKTLGDLRGKTLGLTKAGDVTDILARLALQKAGLVPQKDVHLLYLGSQPAQLAALQKGAVQAVLVSPPIDLEAEAEGGHEVLDLTSIHLPFPADGIVSTRTFVRAHPQTVIDYLRAYLEAIRFIRAHPAQTEAVLGKYTHQTNPKVLQHSYQLLVQVMPSDPQPSVAALRTVLDFAPGGKGKNPASFIDAAPLKAAMAGAGG